MNVAAHRASVVIPTRNRKEELRVALHSILKQTVQPEIIVLDDASTDGTPEMMEKEFPTVIFVGSEQPKGGFVQRNIGTNLASNGIIFSIDDDMDLPDPTIIEQTLKYFDHPRVGIVTIPYVNVKKGPDVFQRAPEKNGLHVAFTFGAGGYAIRSNIFQALNGFNETIFMGGGEEELSIRMLDIGYVVRLGRATPILHFLSPTRQSALRFMIKCRNHILIPWLNAPTLILPFHLVGTCINNLVHGWRNGKILPALKGLIMGFKIIFSEYSNRKPVRLKTYLLFRKLRKVGPLPLSEIEKFLPPI